MSSSKCDICKQDYNDPIEMGDIMKKSNIEVHYYCLLLSTNLMQLGEDGSGILGFLIKDIKQEIFEAKTRTCCYCKMKHASIKCNDCDVYFHLSCGLKNNCLFKFYDQFLSYCHKHSRISHERPHDENEGCFICLGFMGKYNPLTSITPNCCDIGGWFHRKCLKRYALSSGYYLKCLICHDVAFRNYVRLCGVFVPDRDASWEREKEAYSELLVKFGNECLMKNCLSPNGRKFKKSSGEWKIHVCTTCGSFAAHVKCSNHSTNSNEYVCESCTEILNKINESKKCELQPLNNYDIGIDKTLYIPKSLSLAYMESSSSQISVNEIDNKVVEEETSVKETVNQTKEQSASTSSQSKLSNKDAKDLNKSQTENQYLIYDATSSIVLGVAKESDYKKGMDVAVQNMKHLPKDNTNFENFVKNTIEEHVKKYLEMQKNIVANIDITGSDSDSDSSNLLSKM